MGPVIYIDKNNKVSQKFYSSVQKIETDLQKRKYYEMSVSLSIQLALSILQRKFGCRTFLSMNTMPLLWDFWCTKLEEMHIFFSLSIFSPIHLNLQFYHILSDFGKLNYTPQKNIETIGLCKAFISYVNKILTLFDHLPTPSKQMH